ncbi:MAG: glycine--tRNA ligase subunit beta [Candidatus Aminicenantes bacterium]|nr:glycine--tRNA ligase subunit beta [Candidatus Aminicenantes bacterium]
MSDFLFELGVEEVPVHEINKILGQLEKKFREKLTNNRVGFKAIETAATNRRFMIYFNSINEKADDIEEQVKGPSTKVAYDKDGQPTVALRKFMEANRIQAGDLKEIKTPKGLYAAFERQTEGKPGKVILTGLIPEVLGELTFSKGMLWNESRVPFVRPITNILALFDNKLIECEFAGIVSSNLIAGHTLLSDRPIKVNSFKDYCEFLNKNFVLISADERKKKIIDEIVDVEEEYNVRVQPDQKILDDYIYNNEYPVLFSGEFDKKYLELPAEIISTFMINEKKLMPAYDKENKIVNIFVGVSNIPDENKNVVRGNERVIRATFEDAKFFWDNDRRDDFPGLRENLENVMFHEGLGNFYEKTDRLASLIDFLVKETGKDHLTEDIKQAALFCKNDLITRMVREFPSLQGIMGGLYLQEVGEKDEVRQAVYAHYEPKGFTDAKLENIGAGILSIADKIDNICGFIFKGIKISSSKDPYGIRRDAGAIIKIIKDFKLDFDLLPLIRYAAEKFMDNYDNKQARTIVDITSVTKQLFISRIENIFKDTLKFRYDIVNAVLDRTETLFVYRVYLKAYEISTIMQADSIQHLVSLHKRLRNIIKKTTHHTVYEERLIEKEEKALFEVFKESKTEIEIFISDNKYLPACSRVLEMKPAIDKFFDNVLVMDKDPEVRENRIALLQRLDELLSRIADFSLIVE